MKKLLFPLLILLVAVFATSCIKNSESEGVKAVRMGYAALLQAQAEAAITEANADDKVATAQAAYVNAQAAVETAQAAVVQAQAAAQLLDNAAQTERNRHRAAENALWEAVDAAESALDKQSLVNALAEENAQSANRLLQIGLQKAQLQDQTATAAIQAQVNLINAQTALADAQVAASEATATRVAMDAQFVAQLAITAAANKVANLNLLAADYAAASAAYNAQQANIDVLNNNLIRATQGLAALTQSLSPDSIFASDPLPPAVPQNFNVRALRTTVNNAIADVASKTTAVTTATNNLNTSKAVLAADQAVLAGLQIEVIEQVIKDTLKAEQTRYKGITDKLLIATVQISDVDFVAARTAADATLATAQTAFNNAVIAANGPAKTDSTNAEFFFKLNVNPAFAPAVAAGWVNPNPPGLTCWQYTINGVFNSNVPFASAVQFQNLNPVDPNDDAARAAAQVCLTFMTNKYNVILATQAALRATVVSTLAALNSAHVVADPLDAKFATLNTAIIAITAQKTASLARQAALQAEITFLDGVTGKPTDLIWADVNNKIIADQADVTAKTTALATANTNLTTSKNTLAAAQTALAAGLVAYALNKPFDVELMAFMTLQIADINTQIAAAKIILAQDLAVVNLWLAKIQTALQ